MVVGTQPESSAPEGLARGGGWGTVAVVVSFVLAAAYFALFLLVRDAEMGADENTFGAYLFLSAAYVVLGVAAWRAPGKSVYVAGIVVQVLVIVLFVVFAVGLLGPGIFDYERVDSLRMEAWAVATLMGQIGLIGLFAALLARDESATGSIRGAESDVRKSDVRKSDVRRSHD